MTASPSIVDDIRRDFICRDCNGNLDVRQTRDGDVWIRCPRCSSGWEFLIGLWGDLHGACMENWPADLRVREYPTE